MNVWKKKAYEDRGENEKRLKKYRWGYGLGIAVLVIVLAVFAVHTQQRIQQEKAEIAESEAAERRRIEVQESIAESIQESLAESAAARESEEAKIDGMLEGEVREAYETIFVALSDGKYGEAAKCLNEQEEKLEQFYERKEK